MVDIKKADSEVKELHEYLSTITNDIVNKQSKTLDSIISQLSTKIDSCSNEELRGYMARISIEAYNLAMFREQSSLKESCANALYKEGIANTFNSSTGTVESRKNLSMIKNMDRQAVSILYSGVSELFKTKTDEAHRLANIINGILISRSADAKLVCPNTTNNNEDVF